MKRKNNFPKSERLTSRKIILELLKEGKVFKTFPFYVKYSFSEKKSPNVQVLINVSKKRFKRAVDRNFIKRLIREAYRQNNAELHNLLNDSGLSVNLLLNFINTELPNYATINTSMQELLTKLCNKIEQNVDKREE